MWKPGWGIPIVDLVTRPRGRTRHRSSNIRSRVTSGLASLTVSNRPREIAIGRLSAARLWGDKKSSPPSQTRSSISLLNSNEELCSAYVGRNDGYKGPSPRDLPLHGDFSATSTPRHLRDYIGANDEHRCYIGDHRGIRTHKCEHMTT